MPLNSGSIANFTGTAISNTYQRVVQTDGVTLADGTGSILDNLTLPNLSVSGNLYVGGTLYAENTVTVTQSYYSGSQIFGDQLTDTHRFTGSILSTGSNIFTGTNTFIGVTVATGSFTGSFTGSLFGTSSYALNALTASHALTASSADSFVVRNSFTASGLRYPIADNGEFSFIQTDGNGNLSLQYVNTLYEVIVNGETTTITKGTPVYVSGSQGANSIVYRADAGNPAKMPVIYISADNIASGATGRGIVLGLITGVNTTGYPAGTEIFAAVGGGYTATRPTGSAIVQVLGIVTKEGNGGQGVVLNPGPANLPNLPSGSVWVGNSGSFPTAVLTSSLSVASASFAISASYALTASYVPIIDGGTF